MTETNRDEHDLRDIPAEASAGGPAAGAAPGARERFDPSPSTVSAGPAGVASAIAASAAATGSWLDDRWSRLTRTPAARRRAELILLCLVTLIAAIPRFWNLGAPMSLVFDETFYVKDSWSLVHLGYEAKWPGDANDLWAAGDPDTYLTDPAYVVHPPLGKLLIGLGMLIVGADNPVGWRITVAVLGTLLVPLVWIIARRLFRSPALASVAALLVAIDGHAIVLSRISILDGILTFFVMLGFLFVLLDRDDQRAKIQRAIGRWRREQSPPLEGEPAPAPISTTMRAPASRPSGPDWGPALWNRPWLMAAAAAFGCASAVKWSGLYFLAAFCVFSLVIDMLERRRQGVTFWASGAFLKQGPISFLLTIPLALAVYLATWLPWLTTSGGFYRDWAEQPGNAFTGALAWVPLSLQSLWHYQVEAYKFHTTLQATHAYQSAPWQWPFLLRPTAFSYVYHSPGDGSGCQAQQCVEAITSLSNPLVWWLGTAAILVLLVFQLVRPNWQAGLILVGYGAGYLPWLAVTERSAVFHFYAIVMLPFMALATTAVVRQLIGTSQDGRRERTISVNALLIGLGVLVLVSCLFLPVWMGWLIPDWYWNLTHWLPGWR